MAKPNMLQYLPELSKDEKQFFKAFFFYYFISSWKKELFI